MDNAGFALSDLPLACLHLVYRIIPFSLHRFHVPLAFLGLKDCLYLFLLFGP